MLRRFLSVVTGVALLSSFATIINTTPTYAQGAPKFECRWIKGKPTTVAVTPAGLKPVITWRTWEFAAAGYDPLTRCQEVAERFNNLAISNREAREQGKAQFVLTAGIVNNQPVICAATSLEEGCNTSNVLVTLNKKNRRKTAEILQQLTNLRQGVAGTRAVQESSGRAFIDINKLVNSVEAEQSDEAPTTTPNKAPNPKPSAAPSQPGGLF
jgi:Circadian oscillating protein COP23